MNTILTRALRPLRGANLEVFKFGMYLMFPIGWMYYFGTNLENRFTVSDFWPTQEQSHKIPFEKEEIKAEVERIQREMKERKELQMQMLSRRREETDSALEEAKRIFRREREGGAGVQVAEGS